MAAPNVEQLLVQEANRIGPQIYRKTLNTSPWLKLVKQGSWPDQMGHTISVLTYERSLPANPLSWNNVAANKLGSTSRVIGDTGTVDGSSGGSCVPPKQEISFAQTLRTYNLQHTALESPKICVNDLRFPVYRQEQLTNIMSILTENTSWAWINRYRDEYLRVAANKIVVNGSLPVSSSDNPAAANFFPQQQASSNLTQGVLDRLYLKLIRAGANNNPQGRENGQPIFTLICGAETSRALIRDNADIRQDFRWADPSELLKPLGVTRSYGGYYHLIDDLPPRYNWDGTKYVRVHPYGTSSSTYGPAVDISAAYESAAYEASIIFHTDVLESLIPAPITSPGANLRFDPVNYRGVFSWKNYLTDDNPDGQFGYFRGILSNGTKPIRPEFGYVIMHRRCDSPLNLVACS